MIYVVFQHGNLEDPVTELSDLDAFQIVYLWVSRYVVTISIKIHQLLIQKVHPMLLPIDKLHISHQQYLVHTFHNQYNGLLQHIFRH